MTREVTGHWILEWRKDDHCETASGIDKSARFDKKEDAKEAGEHLVSLSNYEWEDVDVSGPFAGSDPEYDGTERLKVGGTLIRVRPETIEIHEEGELPEWVERHWERKKQRLIDQGHPEEKFNK